MKESDRLKGYDQATAIVAMGSSVISKIASKLMPSAGSFPLAWPEFSQKLTFAVSDIQQQILETCRSSPENGISGEEMIYRRISEVMSELSSELASNELNGGEAILQEMLTAEVFQALSEEERRLLSIGLKLSSSEDLKRYAILELSLAVEKSLRNRLFDPMRNFAGDPSIMEPKPGSTVIGQTKGYLLKKNQLQLGHMVEFTHNVFSALNEPENNEAHPIVRAACQLLMTLPRAQIFRQGIHLEARKNALTKIKELRNANAHDCSLPDEHTFNELLDVVIKNPESAFFRYWIEARVDIAAKGLTIA